VEGKLNSHSVDLVVEGRCYINGIISECAIAVDEGKIVAIGKPVNMPKADSRMSVNGKRIILPGMVDMHVHMRDLEEVHKEDWYSGSLSALAGGVTFVADMPNNKPYIDSLERLKLKLNIAKRKALIDFGFYVGYPSQLKELQEMKDFGILGIKIYPTDYNKGLERLAKSCEKLNIPIILHAEDPEIIEKQHFEAERKVENHHLLRPEKAEIIAIKNLLGLLSKFKTAIHFTHISSFEAASELINAKKRGELFTWDTCPHYFFLDHSLTLKLKGIAKTNPPLRSSMSARLLSNIVYHLLIDSISTDHAPHALEEKLRDNYDEIPSGFPGLEICLPLLMKLIIDEKFPLEVLELYSSKPAKILQIPKGSLLPGLDGDLVIYDYSIRWSIHGENFYSKAKYTPFEGMEVVGKPDTVIIRGEIAWEKGEDKVKQGFGKYVRPYRSSNSELKI